MSAKKTTRKKSSRSNSNQVSISFNRWLLPGLLTILFFLLNIVLSAIFIALEGGLSPVTATATSIVMFAMFASLTWWVAESILAVVRMFIRDRR